MNKKELTDEELVVKIAVSNLNGVKRSIKELLLAYQNGDVAKFDLTGFSSKVAQRTQAWYREASKILKRSKTIEDR